ncbi:Methyltransferase domain-containing protein [Mariniphaga anaerophila]|uniref:Methyltransferase domain-containing protein n=1 Tax=Mariniphaga anaerophila TaxID=1484053 RepID=A0A1M5BLD8_9BACT|nr:class I SAM-dependent methyltransferase [Mariniphaga anaerophila]SHF43032.1 Methyltransferase domain-containing protein [Mariniphaga anaerophila]
MKKIETTSRCRFCNSKLKHSVINLGMSPLCQKHVKPENANDMEKFYPLHAYICEHCWLMQLEEFATPDEIFADEYAYFSSYSESWLNHAKKYTDLMIDRFSLNSNSLVTEIASNDGYLLQWFVQKEIPVLGIEPAENVAAVAKEKGIRTEIKFFGKSTAIEMTNKYGKADLLLGNNVLAHVPDINDFVAGMKEMLNTEGVITMEFPHLQRLIEGNQFDTIYHEHFSYLSFSAVNRIFAHHGITLFDVEELPTHGGSLRIYGKHAEDDKKEIAKSVSALLKREIALGFETLEYYSAFEEKVKETKRKILDFLIDAKRNGKTVAGYGAPGKGNTLLNYCGIRTDFIDFTVDMSPHKQGNFLPGTHIPILHPEAIKEYKPDYLFILPWNLKKEIMNQHSYVRDWGGKFVIPIPELTILN